MSDFEYYEGLEGAGDDGTHQAPDSLWTDVSTGVDDNDTYENHPTFTYEDAEWGPAVESDSPDGAAYEPIDLGADYAGEPGGDDDSGGGLLDGIDLDLSALDLGGLADTAFDATYDLIGSDPAEPGWWSDLVSDHNADGAYGTVATDDPYIAL